MLAASLHDIKKGLTDLDDQQLKALCLRLAKFKKENKELVTYLLFESHDEQAYVDNGQQEIKDQFAAIPNLSVYYAKKSIRKILRLVNKQIKYSGIITTELALRIQFCQELKASDIPVKQSVVLVNLYQQQLKKINQALIKLEEDLQYDFQADISHLTL